MLHGKRVKLFRQLDWCSLASNLQSYQPKGSAIEHIWKSRVSGESRSCKSVGGVSGDFWYTESVP